MGTFPFAHSPAAQSPLDDVVLAERYRQWRTLVMIPSESLCHPVAASLLGTELGHIYAEGLPEPILCHDPRESAGDAARFASWQTRLADRRFYKGTIEANRAELLAQKAIAEVFARLPGSPRAEAIHVNMQALSGAAANLAVFEALLEPGDRLMGLDLAQGGHLTHGSRFNFSGRTYEVHSYGIDPKARRLDYRQIREQALAVRPKLIIGGASSYPWDFDWTALRGIADEVGAYLLADVAHLAGLIAGGVLMNPLPHAHVVTFTTHKTTCGPRGAAILSPEPEIGRMLDTAVFPGLQGGPHMNSIAAIGRIFELIGEDYEGFCAFQRRTIENTAFFAQRLQDEGFVIEYGGTNTHMVLVDLKPFPVKGATRLDGETASRLLEIAGVVCNKNVLPGDIDAAHASGLRFGLPWLTQRGVTKDQLAEIASIVKAVLAPVQTFTVWSPQGDERCRGRIPAGVLRPAAERTLAIAEQLPYPAKPEAPRVSPAVQRIGKRAALLMRGDKVRLALEEMVTARLPVERRPVRAWMLAANGAEIADVTLLELPPQGREERWLVLPPADRAEAVIQWVRDLSDGYLLFDEADLHQKIDGPSVIEGIDPAVLPADVRQSLDGFEGEPELDMTKACFIGQRALGAVKSVPHKHQTYIYEPKESPVKKTVLNDIHRQLGAKMAPFAGWDMPIQYPTGILAEHRAVRKAAGLFDVTHMSAIEVAGRDALSFLEALLANSVSRLDPGEAQYSYMLYPDGTAVDDLYVYRMATEKFMLVVNAANAERVMDWIGAVSEGRVIIDPDQPAKQIGGDVAIRPLRDVGEDSLVGLALQGPKSIEALHALTDARDDALVLKRLQANQFAWVSLKGIRCLAARTGYTGEKIGFEIYAHPARIPDLWTAILDAGKPLGVLPAGLGSRDSTRIEAGFPLFGHELEGEQGLSLTEAGYGFVVRFHVPFFIGRTAYRRRLEQSRRHVVRLKGNGRKSLRAGHVILDPSGKPAGVVTSFAYTREDMTFYVLASLEGPWRPAPGEKVLGARLTADKVAGPVEERAQVELLAMPRFPDEAEKGITD